MLGRLVTALSVAFALGLAAPAAHTQDLLVEDSVRADLAVAAALGGHFADAADTIASITRLEVRDATNNRLAAIAARKAGEMEAVELAAKFSTRISNAGSGRDASMDVAIELARRGMLDQAERMAAVLEPQRRDKVRAVIAMVLAMKHQVRDAWSTARRTNDIGRRRDSLITVRGGLGESLSVQAAIGAALGADTQAGRVRSLIAVARGMVARGERTGALTALSHIPRQLRTGFTDSAVTEDATADRAMVLLSAGDVVGARQAATGLRSDAVRRFLLRQIDEFRKFRK